MRFAIVESGGKQYRAVEGTAIEVDRLPAEAGVKHQFDKVLLMSDGDDVFVGTPTVKDVHVRGTIVEHFRGSKVVSFRYSPKKRIRVKGGHRQHYSRVMVDFIGRAGEERTPDRAEGRKTSTAPRKAKAAPRQPAAKSAAKKAKPAKK